VSDYNVIHGPLTGLTPLGITDGMPALLVDDAVRVFQVAQGLTADGLCGVKTVRRALEIMTSTLIPKAPCAVPNGYDGIIAQFGDPCLRDDATDPRRLHVTNSEYLARIKTIAAPIKGGTTKVRLREEIADYLIVCLDWLAANLAWAPHRIDSFVPRKKNWSPTGNPSIHSYGLAVDFDPLQNGRGNHKPAIPQVVFLALWAMGWNCGRFWRGVSTDPMHIAWANGC